MNTNHICPRLSVESPLHCLILADRGIQSTSRRFSILFSLFCTLTFAITVARTGFTQVLNSGNDSGIPQFVGFHNADVDSVNLNSRALHVEIPIASLKERGHNFVWKFVYNTPSFSAVFLPHPTSTDRQAGYWEIVPQLEGAPPNNWFFSDPFVWSFGYDLKNTDSTGEQLTCDVGPDPIFGGEIYDSFEIYSNYRLIDPEGTQHPTSLYSLKLTGTYVPQPEEVTPCPFSTIAASPTLDGTGMLIDLNKGVLMLKDGTQIAVNAPGLPYGASISGQIQDTNGNLLNDNAPGLPGNQIVTQAGGVDPMHPASVTVLDALGAAQTYSISYQDITITTNDCQYISHPGDQPCSEASGIIWSLPHEIHLPNGTAYTFSYVPDSHGELESITLPSGGTITYTFGGMQYDHSGTVARTGPVPGHNTIASRTVNDGSSSAEWLYQGGIGGVTVTNPDGNCDEHISSPIIAGSAVSYNRVETQRTQYSGCGPTATALLTTNTTYAADLVSIDDIASVGNVRPTQVKKTLGAVTSMIQTDYETFTFPTTSSYSIPATRLNPTEIREFDYGATTPTRTTDYTYLHNVGSSNVTAATYTALNIVDRRATETVYSGSNSGTKMEATQYSYDTYTQGIGSESNPSSHNISFSTNYYSRGNLTAASHWLNTTNSWITSYFNYDVLGNVTLTTDPRGNNTSYIYSDSWADSTCTPSSGSNYSYITSKVDPLGHTTSYTYESCTGQLASVKDPNDIANKRAGTVISYADPMNRVTQITYPDSGSKSYAYTDGPSSTIQETNAVGVITTQTADGLLRTIKTAITSNPGGPTVVDTAYDFAGRVISRSNSHRSTSSPTDGTTSYAFDGIGRVTMQCQPDNGTAAGTCAAGTSYQKWSYTDNSVTFQDEGGSQWQRTSDAFGRLTSVVEPAGAKTYYKFDVLGNLTCAAQNGGSAGSFTSCSAAPASWRPRVFVYDSLSRLVSASNPESGIVGYTYDANGNLITKTSQAVNATSGTQTLSYCYDALNRITYKFYTSTFSCTQPVGYAGSYSYDTSNVTGSQNIVGRLTDEESYVGATLVSERQPYAYDAMGRLLQENQYVLPGTASAKLFSPSYQYDLAGNLIASTDGATPVQSTNTTFPCVSSLPWTTLAFSNCFDSAGRLSSLTSNWATYPTNLFTVGSSNGYNPAGQLQNWTQGSVPSGTPALSVTQGYTNRLWLQSITANGQTP